MTYFQNNKSPTHQLPYGTVRTYSEKNSIFIVPETSFKDVFVGRDKNVKSTAMNYPAEVDVYHTEDGGKYLNEHGFGMFYHRVITSKSLYNTGVVTGDKTERFSIFNAHEYPITLTSTSIVNIDGIRVLPEKGGYPITIPPYRSVDMRILLSGSGAVTINGKILLDFSNAERVVLTVTGSRLVLWNVEPNWKSSVNEQFEYKTDILTSYNKKEQRRSLMTHPRRRISYSANPRREILTELRNTIHGWHDKEFSMPLWWQSTTLSKPIASGSNKITVQDSLLEFVKGGLVVLWRDGSYTDTLMIDSVDGNVITTESLISKNFQVGDRVFPAARMRLSQEALLNALTSRVGAIDVEMTGDFRGIPMPEQAPSAIKINGVEVLDKKPNWVNTPTERYAAVIDTVDYGYGLEQVYNRGVPSLAQRELTFVAKTPSEITWWRAFIHRQRGALKSFFVPSYTNDAIVAFDIVENSHLMTIRGESLANIVNASKDRKYMRIVTKSKTYYRTIDNVKLNGENSTITFTEAFDANIPIGNIIEVNFMQRMRFAGDDIAIEYLSRNVAQIAVNLQQIREI